MAEAAGDGAEIGSCELVFRPERVRPGEYRSAVGTAGSTTLVLQTVLPALMLASGPSRLTLEGGTHNPSAPPFDFLATTFLPQLARFGPKVHATLLRPGFYPAGGGRMEIAIDPVPKLQAIELHERGADAGRRVIAHLAALGTHIAGRAFEQIEKRMSWDRSCCTITEHPAECGPGFVLTAEIASTEITETFTGFGEKGIRAEQVADGLIDQARHYLSTSAPVGEYLADQLLIPLALAGGGGFRAVGVSRHARTNIDVIHQFLPARIQTNTSEKGGVDITLARRDWSHS